LRLNLQTHWTNDVGMVEDREGGSDEETKAKKGYHFVTFQRTITKKVVSF